jgi:hypothetical protein
VLIQDGAKVAAWEAHPVELPGLAKVGRAEMWFMAALAAEQGAV